MLCEVVLQFFSCITAAEMMKYDSFASFEPPKMEIEMMHTLYMRG